MKEIKSTEFLDKQIHVEAAKKIQSILENADKECEVISNSVAEELEKSRNQKQEFYNNKIDDERKNLNATFPLEKQRLELSFVQNSLIDGINNYLEALGEEKKLALVLKELKNQASFWKDKKCSAYIYGFDFNATKKELEKILGDNLTAVEKTEYGKMIIEEEIALKTQQGIILEAEDKSFRLRLTINQIISHILDVNREELTVALFGDGEND